MTVLRAIRARIALALAFDWQRGSTLRLDVLGWRELRQVNQRRIRSRCVTLNVADGIAVSRVLGRYKMFLQSDDYGHAVHLMFDGFWEMPVTEAVAALVRPGMVAADIGANQGDYTLLLAGLVGAGGRVHAIEPNPRMTALLGRSLGVNGLMNRVTVHTAAVGAEPNGRGWLRVLDNMPSGAFLESAGAEADAIETTTLDRLLDGQRIDLIKIDAEGAEVAIWTGMQAILARRTPLTVMMEFIADRTPDPAGFLARVAQQGFSFAYVHNFLGVQPVTPAAILAAPANQEWMLVLRRRPHD